MSNSQNITTNWHPYSGLKDVTAFSRCFPLFPAGYSLWILFFPHLFSISSNIKKKKSYPQSRLI
jgi:hypothetical protein